MKPERYISDFWLDIVKYPSVLLSVLLSVWVLSWNSIITSFFLNFDVLLETPMKLCVIDPDILGNFFFVPKLWEMGQKFMLFAAFLHKSHIWEKSFWDVGQNPLSQSDCRIFKSNISSEQIDETTSFSACWYKFLKCTHFCTWPKMGVA